MEEGSSGESGTGVAIHLYTKKKSRRYCSSISQRVRERDEELSLRRLELCRKSVKRQWAEFDGGGLPMNYAPKLM